MLEVSLRWYGDFCCNFLWNFLVWFYKAEIFTLLPLLSHFPWLIPLYHASLLPWPFMSLLLLHAFACAVCFAVMPFTSLTACRVFTHSLKPSFLLLNWYQEHLYFLQPNYLFLPPCSLNTICIPSVSTGHYGLHLFVCIWISTTTLGGPGGYRPYDSFSSC